MSLKVTMKIILMKKNFSISKGEEEKKNWRWKKVIKEIEKINLKKKRIILLEKLLNFDSFVNNIKVHIKKRKTSYFILGFGYNKKEKMIIFYFKSINKCRWIDKKK